MTLVMYHPERDVVAEFRFNYLSSEEFSDHGDLEDYLSYGWEVIGVL